MTEDFKDIKIDSWNDKATYKSDPNTTFRNVILDLSASAPPEWADLFNNYWANNFLYMTKAKASISGSRLEIYCVPTELEKVHYPVLKNIISKTNQEYREYLVRKQSEADDLAAKEAAERDKLANIKRTLKFD
jgi:hypothetical protein